MALARYILGKFLGVGCHCFPPPLDVPTFSTRCLHVQRHKRPLAAEGGTLRGQEMFWQISSRIRLPCNSRNLLHAANLRHETDGFTSPPNEGMLRIFSPLKIRRLRPGLNPRTWVPKASTLTPRPPKPLEWHIVIRISWHFSKCCSCHFRVGESGDYVWCPYAVLTADSVQDGDWLASSPTMLNATRWQVQQFPKHQDIFIELCGLIPKDNPVQWIMATKTWTLGIQKTITESAGKG